MNEEKDLFLCVEIGGTNLRYGVADLSFQLLTFDRISSAGLSDAADKGVYLQQLLDPLLKTFGRERFICVTLSLASLMDKDRTICYNSPNLKGFDHLPLKKILEEIWGLPVIMERDVNTALLYDLWVNGLMNQEGIVMGVYIGTGLGNAMSIDGKIYKGFTGSSCELGHIPVDSEERMCGCGKKGCIELRACGKVLAEAAARHQCPVSEIFEQYPEAEDVRDVVRMCALAAATEVTILDPVCMILGGGVTTMRGFPMQYFKDTVAENLRIPEPRKSLRIIPASSDPQAGIVGAAIHAAGMIVRR